MRRANANGVDFGKPETFNFLGFTFICGKSRSGGFLLKRKSRGDRVRAKLAKIGGHLRKIRHAPLMLQGEWLGAVVKGWFNYFAVPTNFPTSAAFRHHVVELWRRALNRRSQPGSIDKARMKALANEFLPRPKILHPWPERRFAVKHPRWEAVCGNSARTVLCGGRSAMSVPTAISDAEINTLSITAPKGRHYRFDLLEEM